MLTFFNIGRRKLEYPIQMYWITGFNHWQQRDVLDVFDDETIVKILQCRQKSSGETHIKEESQNSPKKQVRIVVSECYFKNFFQQKTAPFFFSRTLGKRRDWKVKKTLLRARQINLALYFKICSYFLFYK